ncbi:MAG: outer membrane beta-barrel protein [Bacteroidota bacterium]
MDNRLYLLFLLTIVFGIQDAACQLKSFIDLSIETGSAFRDLNNGNDQSDTQYTIDIRDQNEVSKSYWRIGLSYNRNILSRIFFRTGLRISKIGYESNDLQHLLGGNPYSDYPHMPGRVIDVFAPVQIHFDHYHLELPMAFRYEILKSRLSPFVEAGVNVNYLLNAYSNVQIGDNDNTRVSILNEENFNRIQFGYHFGAGASYRIEGDLQLFTQLRFNFLITSTTKSAVEERLNTTGLELGVRSGF